MGPDSSPSVRHRPVHTGPRELRERSRDSRATCGERHKLLQEHDYSGPTEKTREEDKIDEMPGRVRENGKPPQKAAAIEVGGFPQGWEVRHSDYFLICLMATP